MTFPYPLPQASQNWDSIQWLFAALWSNKTAFPVRYLASTPWLSSSGFAFWLFYPAGIQMFACRGTGSFFSAWAFVAFWCFLSIWWGNWPFLFAPLYCGFLLLVVFPRLKAHLALFLTSITMISVSVGFSQESLSHLDPSHSLSLPHIPQWSLPFAIWICPFFLALLLSTSLGWA